MELQNDNRPQQIVYSCYYNKTRTGEQFVPEHVFSYQISGTLYLNDGNKNYISNAGNFIFTKRNQLLKFNKQPPENGEFKTISIYFDQATLKNFSLEFNYNSSKHIIGDGIIELQPQPLFKSLTNSLLPYLELNNSINEQLQQIKLKEALLILIQTNPALKDILFDFNEPGKIDLESFMNKNFHFNVQLKRFAYLTGRSLATFKRDFEKTFNATPSRWLLQKRLQEAYYLIKEKGKAVSDVYLDVGFEDLSHFSFAFKNRYGVAPSMVSG